ncbi:hypothetical protein DMP75_17620 [Klebsiella michiganensis]|nr:hypothetical protein DMP75_17620 [Klebsiella michiganensis]
MYKTMRQINNSQVINILYNVTTAIKILFGDLNDKKQKMLYALKIKTFQLTMIKLFIAVMITY